MSDQPDMHDAAVEGAFGFVLALRDHVHGLSFWNNAYGFGPLFNATVFREAEAATFVVPMAGSEPEWLALPAPFRGTASTPRIDGDQHARQGSRSPAPR